MSNVNKIDIKKSQTCNCTQFVSLFISKIDVQASAFNEVSYELKSLKRKTRNNRTKGLYFIYCYVSDVAAIIS